MNTVADYTDPSLLQPLLRCRDAAAVAAELCSTLHRLGRVNDLLPFYHAVISHEAVSSTVISPGWALPHARIADLPALSFALGRTAEPLAWFDGQPVNTIFLFAVPESDAAAYLRLIAGLARLGQDRWRLSRLVEAPDSQAMFEVLREIRLPGRPAATVHAR